VAASARRARSPRDQDRCCLSTLPVRAKNLAAPLVQLIGVDLVRLREVGSGVIGLTGLLDQLAFEFSSEVASFKQGSVRLSFGRIPLDVRLPQEAPICASGSRQCWVGAFSFQYDL